MSTSLEWQTTLPIPLVDFSGAPRNSTIASSTDSAKIIRRSRFGKSYVVLSVTWCLTDVQYEYFRVFFVDTLGNGMAQFNIELRYPETSKLTRWSVRFVGGYQISYDEGLSMVKASLELINLAPPITLLTSLIARWEALTLLGKANASPITILPDTSGYERSAIQLTGSKRPLYRTNMFGASPGIFFDGINDLLLFSPISVFRGTLFFVWRFIGGTGNGGVISWRGTGVQAGFLLADCCGNSAFYGPNLIVTNGLDDIIISRYGGSDYDVAPFPAPASIHVQRWDGSNIQPFEYGVPTDTYAFGKNNSGMGSPGLPGYTNWAYFTFDPTLPRTPTIACIGGSIGFCNCVIGAILVFNRPLSDGEIAIVVTDLNSRYPCF